VVVFERVNTYNSDWEAGPGKCTEVLVELHR
jgi:hypothetical protein